MQEAVIHRDANIMAKEDERIREFFSGRLITFERRFVFQEYEDDDEERRRATTTRQTATTIGAVVC